MAQFVTAAHTPGCSSSRVDSRGLAFMLADGAVIAMDERQAIIRLHRGGEHRYRRWADNPGAALAWDIDQSAAAP